MNRSKLRESWSMTLSIWAKPVVMQTSPMGHTLDALDTGWETEQSIKSRVIGTNLPARARWSAQADAALWQPSGIKPSHLTRVFPGFSIGAGMDDSEKLKKPSVSEADFLESIRRTVAALEARMNHQAKPLSVEEQEILETRIFYANRMRKWID